MAFQVVLNFLLAFIWMFLASNYSARAFIIGYLLGLICLFIVQKMLPGRFYFGKIWAFFKLTILFIKELILANIAVVKVVLNPKLTMNPAFFKYETTLTKEWEITLLSSLITLTPGTVVVHLSDDSKTLYIHAIDAADIDETAKAIRNSFEKAIREVSRS